jgi:hypothetical protein
VTLGIDPVPPLALKPMVSSVEAGALGETTFDGEEYGPAPNRLKAATVK